MSVQECCRGRRRMFPGLMSRWAQPDACSSFNLAATWHSTCTPPCMLLQSNRVQWKNNQNSSIYFLGTDEKEFYATRPPLFGPSLTQARLTFHLPWLALPSKSSSVVTLRIIV